MNNEQKNNKLESKRIRYLMIAVAFILICTLLILCYRKLTKEKSISITVSTMETSFRDIASLATEEYNFTNVGILDKEKKKLFFISVPFTGKNMLVVYSGVVKAGIKDCSNIQVDVNYVTKEIIIKCPKPEIFEDPVIDPNSIEIYDSTNNLITHVTPDDFKDFEIEQQEISRQNAIDNGLITKARDHAEAFIISQANAIKKNSIFQEYTPNVEFF